ncbi:type II toxin-antitoxin system Phd/YefM family antitoxin [bacterium]|nr:type II toxin-antitoxin system Phd/YefM family antitoxin [bacterium]
MRDFTVAEARNQLPNLLHLVESSGSVQISRRGKPVAVVMSMHDYQKLKQAGPTFAEFLSDFRDRHDLTGLEDVFLDVRDRTPGRPEPLFE